MPTIQLNRLFSKLNTEISLFFFLPFLACLRIIINVFYRIITLKFVHLHTYAVYSLSLKDKIMRVLSFLVLLFLISCSSSKIEQSNSQVVKERPRFDPSKVSSITSITVVHDSIAVVSDKYRQ